MYVATERLIIRDPLPEDWRGAHTFLADPEVMCWIHLGPEPFTEAQSQQWITDLIFHNSQQPREAHNCVIVERASQQVIGWIGMGKPSPRWNSTGDLDFGYALARTYHGKGYMTEALKALFQFAFTELNVNTIFAVCETRNTGSYRVMEKAGMTLARQYVEDDERGFEMFLYTISRSQFEAE